MRYHIFWFLVLNSDKRNGNTCPDNSLTACFVCPENRKAI